MIAADSSSAMISSGKLLNGSVSFNVLIKPMLRSARYGFMIGTTKASIAEA
jgi:hypothetical protein